MPTQIHILQYVVLLGSAVWWSKYVIMNRGGGIRWRQAMSALVGALLWIPVAYLSTNVAVTTTGTVTLFGSTALGYVGVVMTVVMLLTGILSLVLWSMEEAEESAGVLTERLPGEKPRG